MSLRAGVKNALLHSLEIVQVHELAAGFRKERLLVPCYHGVVSNDRPSRTGDYYYDAVSATEFTRQLEMLSKWYRFVDLTGAIDWLERGPSGGLPPALITFDDGYRNNLTVAAPILQRLGIPAVFFLTGNYVGSTRVLWPAEIGARIEHSAGVRVPMQDDPRGVTVPLDPVARTALGNRIRGICKTMRNAPRVAYLEELRGATQFHADRTDSELNAFLSWDEARQLASLGFGIGSHTLEHPILSRLDPEELQSELCGSRAKLESELRRPVTVLAYPNGGPKDFNREVMTAATEAGYRHAFAVGDALHSRDKSPMAIRRVIVPGNVPDALFRFIASGCRDMLPWKRKI